MAPVNAPVPYRGPDSSVAAPGGGTAQFTAHHGQDDTFQRLITTGQLSAEHARKLEASAISAEVAAAVTASQPDALAFAYMHPDGASHTVRRLNHPVPRRDNPAKLLRYLAEDGQRGLQVHPLVREHLADATAPLVVVEGTKQTLAAVTALRGVPAAVVGLNGIRGWSWKPGGKDAVSAPLPDWGYIPLKGRAVYVVPDGDVHKPDVARGVETLRAFLAAQGAEVRTAVVPLLPGQDSTGLDDFLAVQPDRPAALKALLGAAGVERELSVVNGLDFLAPGEPDEPPLWGHEKVADLWSSGESLFIFGPPGAGKSTLAHLVVFARLGLLADVLGHQVRDDGRRVLYLAMDRPRQIKRAMRRLVRPGMEAALRERLRVHEGPLSFSLTDAAGRDALRDLALQHGAGTVVVDSIKDVLPDASDEKSAGNYNLARQSLLAAGVELIELHHNRKANGTNREPNTLEDVYGSRWLTAGAGSVVSLWQDEPGTPLVHLRHIRAAGERLNDTTVVLRADTGSLELQDTRTLDDYIRAEGRNPTGFTAAAAAQHIHGGKAKPGQVESVRGRLDRMARRGELERLSYADTAQPFDPGARPVPADPGTIKKVAVRYRIPANAH